MNASALHKPKYCSKSLSELPWLLDNPIENWKGGGAPPHGAAELRVALYLARIYGIGYRIPPLLIGSVGCQ